MGIAALRSYSKGLSIPRWALLACALLIAAGAAYSVAPSTAEAAVASASAGGASAGSSNGPPRNAVPPPPSARNDRFAVREDGRLSVGGRGVLRNDKGTRLKAIKASGPRNGKLVLRRNGTLVYTPKNNFSGRDSFAYKARDNRGRASRAVATIVVRPVNDAPVAKNNAYTTNEDQTLAVATPGVLKNDTDVDRHPLSAAKVSGPAHGALTLNANGSFEYVPDENYNGADSFTYRTADGKGGTDTATVAITIDSVNDKPSFTDGGDQTINEDPDPRPQTVAGWAAGFDPGPPDESGQSLAEYIVTDEDGEPVDSPLFTGGGQPDVANDGTLTYTPAGDAFGSTTLLVKARDDGGTENGGDDTSEPKELEININPVNDAPSFTKGEDETVDEDAGEQTVSGWATDISKGPDNESDQTVAFSASNDDNDLFTTGEQPAISPDGTLTYTPADDANVSATVTVELEDDGGTANGGDDTSGEETFTITVTSVNDAPNFDLGGNQTVDEDSGNNGSHEVSGFVTNVSPGPQDEYAQTVSLSTANNNNDLFTSGGQPEITNGTLSYTLAENAFGMATVTVTATDDGADTPPNDNESEKTFTITVDPVNDAPVVSLDDPPSEVDEGNEYLYNFTVTDPDPGDEFEIKANFPDCGTVGEPVDNSVNETANGGNFQCFFPDGDTDTTVRIQVTDSESADSNIATQSVIVNNVEPNVTAADDQTSNEGADKSFDLGTFTDPGTDGPWTVTVDWGDNSTDTTFTMNSPGSLGARNHTYDDNDTYTVTVTVAEAGAASPPSDSDTFEVAVANVAPTATLGDDGPKNEGSPVTVPFTGQSDPSSADTAAGFRYAYNCDGSAFDTIPTYDSLSGSAASKECTYNDGEHTVRALIVDKDDGSTEHTTTFTVDNVAPTATAQSLTSQAEEPLTITLEATDPSGNLPNPDTLAFEITSLPADGKLFVGEGTNGTEITAATEAEPFELSGNKVTYLPDDAFAGDDGFDFKANDGQAKSAAARVAITVVSASPDTTTITADPTEIVANGTSTSTITVQLKDANNNDVTTGSGYTVALSTTAGTLSNVTNNGDGTFTATLTSPTTVGTATISGTLTGGGMNAEPIEDTATVELVHGPLDGFSVEKAGGGDIETQLAGTPFDVRVTAIDANGNTVESFTGTVDFTSEPSGGISAGATSGAFTEGVLTSHSITFGTPGEFTLTATRTSGTESGTSNEFAVEAPPTATGDGPSANSAPDDPYHTPFNTEFTLAAPGILANDTLGFPAASVTSFGGGDLGGTVADNTAGTTRSPIPVISNDPRFAGVAVNNNGSVTVNGDGSVSFTPPDGFTGVYEFRYRISNARGTSDALVRIAVGERPSAAGDTYSATLVGNVPIDTQTSTNFSVKGNDGGSATTLTVGSQNNGTATLRNDGTFTFNPNAGHEGTASFTYTAKNGFGTSAPATVSMNVSSPVWFVNSGAGTNGDGRFGSPFNCLTGTGCFSETTNDEANDRIFVNSGSYTGGLTLLNGQRLIGQGASGTFGSAANANVSWPADSGAEPSVGGTSPAITTSAASTNGVNVGSGNTLRGFTVGNTTGSGILGNGFGTLAVSGVGIGGSGQALDLTNGTLSGSLSGVTSTSGTNNILLSTVGTNGTFELGSGALSGASGASFRVVSGSGSFTYSGNVTQSNNASLVNVASANTGTLTFGTGTLTATNGNGLQFSNADGTYNFNGTTTLSNTVGGANADAGIDVATGSSGTFNIATTGGSSASITNPSGNAVNIQSSAPTFTYGGSITKTNNTTTGILVQNNTGGAINFSGSSKTLTSTGANAAVNLSSNGNAAINFTNGGLAINGQSNAPGFSATGGGTVKVSGTNNTISTGTGAALNVTNTTIGAGASGEGGLNFRSISANGATNGITLNGTGTSGGLTVAGNGGTCTIAAPTCTGGTIENTTGDGVSLMNTRSPSFSNLLVKDTGRHGIFGTEVVNFTLDNSTVYGAGNADDEDGVHFRTPNKANVTGTMLVRNSLISRSTENNLGIDNYSGTLNLTVDNSDFTETLNSIVGGTSGEEGIKVVANSPNATTPGATINARIHNGSAFDKLESDAITAFTSNAGVMNITVEGNTFTGHTDGDNALSIRGASTGTMRYDVKNNTITGHGNSTIFLSGEERATVHGNVENNDIGNQSVVDSGSIRSRGVELNIDDNSIVRARIHNNRIYHTDFEGIYVDAHDTSHADPITGQIVQGTPNADVTVTNNTIGTPDDNSQFPLGVNSIAMYSDD